MDLKKCNSKYIAILDADDTSYSDRLKIQFNFQKKKILIQYVHFIIKDLIIKKNYKI